MTDPSSNRRRLVGLAIAVAALAGVWYVMSELSRSSRLQNCLASGRRDCVVIDRDGMHPNR